MWSTKLRIHLVILKQFYLIIWDFSFFRKRRLFFFIFLHVCISLFYKYDRSQYLLNWFPVCILGLTLPSFTHLWIWCSLPFFSFQFHVLAYSWIIMVQIISCICIKKYAVWDNLENYRKPSATFLSNIKGIFVLNINKNIF